MKHEIYGPWTAWVPGMKVPQPDAMTIVRLRHGQLLTGSAACVGRWPDEEEAKNPSMNDVVAYRSRLGHVNSSAEPPPPPLNPRLPRFDRDTPFARWIDGSIRAADATLKELEALTRADAIGASDPVDLGALSTKAAVDPNGGASVHFCRTTGKPVSPVNIKAWHEDAPADAQKPSRAYMRARTRALELARLDEEGKPVNDVLERAAAYATFITGGER